MKIRSQMFEVWRKIETNEFIIFFTKSISFKTENNKKNTCKASNRKKANSNTIYHPREFRLNLNGMIEDKQDNVVNCRYRRKFENSFLDGSLAIGNPQ